MIGLTVSLFVCLINGFSSSDNRFVNKDGGLRQTLPIVYNREDLLLLKQTALSNATPSIDFANHDHSTAKQPRKKRGSRGGVRNRLRQRGRRLPLPTVSLTNARSIANKMDELAALMQHDGDYRRCNLFCVTETWLSEDKTLEQLDGYTIIRFDRDKNKTEKAVGGGLLMFVNKQWATNITIRETISTKDFEILTVSFRPHYLPREFNQITVILVYVPGPNNILAADHIAESYSRALNRAPDQPVLLLGDFNTCDITKNLPHLHQYVTHPTRQQKILDKCFVNIPDAYTDRAAPPLGCSDHNVIHLLPTYRQQVKRSKPQVRVIRQWDADSTETLRGCFEATDWDVFFENETDYDKLTDSITSYIQFCEENVVKTKEVKMYANNKPWITKELKACLNEKKIAFLKGDKHKVRDLEKEFQKKVKVAKKEYKDKIEEKYAKGNARDAWKGLNIMMGRENQKENTLCNDPTVFANNLNNFYARFDVHDFTKDCDIMCNTVKQLPESPFSTELLEEEVSSVFSHINPHKASGPDGVSGKLLKVCSSQLCNVFTKLFQLFFDAHFVPRVWKTSTIIPVPKKANASILNDFRPVALTSVLCKCMERLVCNRLMASVADRMDPLQFAYKAKRGVDDATCLLLNLAYQHLDITGNYVRILFMDFSSAFNTLQPHLLLSRLIDLNVSPKIILWIRSFLCDRPQRVLVDGKFSDELVLNTGAPQGCVLSPILFSIYTNEIMCKSSVLSLIKFADDMALVATLKDENSLSEYFSFIEQLKSWFDSSFLELNVQKTKEICLDKRTRGDSSLVQPVIINNETVEQVHSFKYLGIVLDVNLNFSTHVDTICRKANQRLYLLRKLRSFGVQKQILQTVYKSLVESILSFSMIAWYGNLLAKDKTRLLRIVGQANKIIGIRQNQPSLIYQTVVKKKANKIIKDPSHPLYSFFQLLPSGRRFRAPLARKQAFKKSFIPTAVSLLNST